VHGAVGADECLELDEVRVRVLLVVDLDPDAERARNGRRLDAELPAAHRQRGVPVVGVG